MTASIVRSGFLSSVQDLGRPGHRASGVSLGGALDPHALRVANLLVGNAESAAGLEVTLGQMRIGFASDRLVAWAGGEFHARVADDEIPAGHAALVRAGEVLEMSAPEKGARAWLAIAGGIDVPLVLGSRSTDLRSGFGGFEGRTLRDGDQLLLGPPAEEVAQISRRIGLGRYTSWRAPWDWACTAPLHPFLRIVRGPDWSRFEKSTLEAHQIFAVTPQSDRMGLRLEGEPLALATKMEMTSSGVAPGTLQVPPNGQPILLLGDCQTIGGYPKIAHVITVDLPAAAQLQAGDEVRFAEISLTEAQDLLIERTRDLQRFRIGLELHLR
ncbi:MAG: biotin-dependent carboxyltransferase family protein [Chthoniobacterales bacterium]